MIVQQTKFGNQHTFEFHENEVNFAFKDKSGSGDVDIDYVLIPEKTSIQIERNEWLRNVGALWLLIGAFQVTFALLNDKPLSGTGFWVLVGSVCLAAYKWRQVKYTVFRTDQGSLFVLDDKNHDEILKELVSRKRNRLLQLYGEVDPSNDAAQEAEKFRWLHKRGVISDDVLSSRIAEIQRIGTGKEADSGDVLH